MNTTAPITATVAPKPRLGLFNIISMSLGFFGIQFGFALQNSNASRILRGFGADVEELSWFWLAAPLTGMIVQPLIGYYSDRTWTVLGRRRPYFLTGAILASIALFLMPNAGEITSLAIAPLFIGAGILMIMDASFNVAMEPFRALVADLLPADQRTLGFSIQTCLIGLGAVIGSWLPFFLKRWFGIGTEALVKGEVAENVTMAFYIGGFTFLVTILWTVFTTKEYPPGKLEIEDIRQTKHKGLLQIASDFVAMPKTMKQLGVVQFFSWFALFSMWVFSTPAIATHVYGLAQSDTTSQTYQDAADWVGIIFGVYNGVSAVYALALPFIAAKFGRKMTHSISLVAGGIGLISIYFINDPNLLILSMVGVGMAWASILAMPYAILAGSIPPYKMGIYMGVFNFFITLPQIVNGIIGGPIVKYIYGSHAIYSLVMAGVFLIIAAFSVRFVQDVDDTIAA
jgi:maltose/moltooligosaccharide transporter